MVALRFLSKKFITGLLSSLFIVIIGGFLTLSSVSARHEAQEGVRCLPITGKADGVPYAGGGGAAGIFNSGQMDFSEEGYPAGHQTHHDVKACVHEQTEGEGVSRRNPLAGWTWNTNLGYVSFSCTTIDTPDGPRGYNAGWECGGVDYGVSVTTLPDTATDANGAFAGERALIGYAWGHNIGWISLGCFDYDGDGDLENYQTGIVGDPEIVCGTIPYGVVMDKDGNTLRDPANYVSFGWTNTVGWIAFHGLDPSASPTATPVVIPSNDPGEDITIVPVVTTPEVTPGEGGGDPDVRPESMVVDAETGLAKVYADGEDSYRLVLRMTRGESTIPCSELTDPSSDTYVNPTENIRLEWAEATFPKYNQVTPGSSDTAPPIVGNFTCSDTYGGFVASISSIAPTEIPHQTNPDEYTSSPIQLRLINVSYGRPGEKISSGDLLPGTSISFPFFPAVEVSSVSSLNPVGGSSLNTLFALRNSPHAFQVNAVRHRSNGFVPANNAININGSFASSGSEYTYYYDANCIFPEETDIRGGDIEDEEGLILREPVGGGENDAFSLLLNDFSETRSGLLESNYGTGRISQCVVAYVPAFANAPSHTISSASLKLAVSYVLSGEAPYNGRTVTYPTRGANPGATINQFARVFGQVQAGESYAEVYEGAISRPIPGEGGSKLRERVFRHVKQLIQGKKGRFDRNQFGGNGEVILTENLLNGDGNISKDIFYFSHLNVRGTDENKPVRVSLEDTNGNGKIDISDSNRRITLLCEGCMVFVDANVPTPLSIVALRDRTIDQENKGGGIYICGNVTETRLTVFADSSIFHYGRDPTPTNSDGTPNYDVSGSGVCEKELYTGANVEDSGGNTILNAGDLRNPNPLYDSCALIDGETGVPIFECPSVDESNILHNQWSNWGFIKSCNTLGGSTKTPPLTCEGEFAEGDNAAFLRRKSKRQDFNYMRWVKWRQPPLRVDIEGELIQMPPYCWRDEILTSSSLDGGTFRCTENTQNFPPKYGIVNLFSGTPATEFRFWKTLPRR